MSDNFELFLEQVKIYQEVERIRARRKAAAIVIVLCMIASGVYYFY